MFSTILDKVTGLFDRRMIISSFFPSLVFWLIVCATWITLQSNWNTFVTGWEKDNITTQFLLLFAFFAWVAFWSILTTNFHTTLTRFFEGYWPAFPLIEMLRQRRIHYWRQQWKQLDCKDKDFEQQQGPLVYEQSAYQELIDLAIQSTTASTGQTAILVIEQELTNFLSEAGKQLYLDDNIPSELINTEQLKQLTTRASDFSSQLRKIIKDCTDQDQLLRLLDLAQRTEKVRRQLIHELSAARQDLYYKFYLYYPSQLIHIMPTQLGNVIRAAELYSTDRYCLDAITIWPRLEPVIPAIYASSFQDTKISFDLMITFASFIILFGLPLAAWATMRLSAPLPWWLLLISFFVALFSSLIRTAFLTLLILLLTILLPTTPIPYIQIPQLPPILTNVQVLCTLLFAIFILFRVSYYSAVQAAIGYGEKIKTAIDLYRWNVLTELHLPFPHDLKEERQTWHMVGALLARSYIDVSLRQPYAHPDKSAKTGDI